MFEKTTTIKGSIGTQTIKIARNIITMKKITIIIMKHVHTNIYIYNIYIYIYIYREREREREREHLRERALENRPKAYNIAKELG
jgi:hypothetical protein